MRKIIVASAVLCAVSLSSCATGLTPVTGFVYSDVKGPFTATEASGSKVGTATCQSLLGWIARGDCSIDTAKKNGGISVVSSVDYKTTSILGLFADVTTIVKGR